MLKKIAAGGAALAAALLLYLLLWPVPIEPVAWEPPPNPGYTGPHAENQRLQSLEALAIGDHHGPEGVAVDAGGRIYVATHEGWIVRLASDGTSPERFAETGGRPLGLDFDGEGNLLVADAFKGLLSIAPDAKVRTLATVADGIPIRYADDVAAAQDGRIYFSDASTKFGAEEWGGTLAASVLEIIEHRRHGRLLVYDPRTGTATTVLDGLSFANGVAVSPDQRFVLVNETGRYRVLRVWLDGPKAGTSEPFVEALPGFPDNITAGRDGRFWVGLVSPRNPIVDALAGRPFLRKVVQRLPELLKPKPVAYGHLIALDAQGRVVQDLQDPEGGYPMTTGAVETDDYLYVSSLTAPVLGRLPKSRAGL